MKLYNSLSKTTEEFSPINKNLVKIYSCGPTVYDSVHIGNLFAFISADTLRRVLVNQGYKVHHVMNFTDVDDKTLKRSRETFPNLPPKEALDKLTKKFEAVFLEDINNIGIDVNAIDFIRATDSIEAIQTLITELVESGIGYMADDGIYFSIEEYKKLNHKYGQLVDITVQNTGTSRIDNDEYDKDNIHDFVLWKLQKDSEPAWEYLIKNKNMIGRPGWHIECSAMSKSKLGQPFDIHTGGVDLKFPHHENEIAQSTATGQPVFAQFFVHNEHVMVDGKKMSKSLNNFYTLKDILDKGHEALAFRLFALQSHYRNRSNFTWVNLKSAQQRLVNLRAMADLRWQPVINNSNIDAANLDDVQETIVSSLGNDINTPKVLELIASIQEKVEQGIPKPLIGKFNHFLNLIDDVLGLNLRSSLDIDQHIKQKIAQRQAARLSKDFDLSDKIRSDLLLDNIELNDTPNGSLWHRI